MTKGSHSLTRKGTNNEEEKKNPTLAQKPILQKSWVMPESQHLAENCF